MVSVKFTYVKLTIRILSLICLFNLLFSFNSAEAQRYVIQVAASKTPIDIQDFSKRHKISLPITEVKSVEWYRYFVGNFEDIRSASEFADDFSIQTGIKGVFPRKIEKSSESLVQEQKISSVSSVEVPTDLIAPADSVLQITEKTAKYSNSLFLRILGIKNTIEFQKDLILFGNDHVPLIIRKIFLRIVEKDYTYPIIILFVFLTIVFILNTIIALLIMYFTNRNKNLTDRKIRLFENIYEEVLRSYLFGEIGWEKTLIKLKKIKKPLNRRILTSVLLNFQENLRGGTDNSIPEIFDRLGLYKDALKSTESLFYTDKVKGIRELTNLYPQGAEDIIQYYLNNQNDLVRTEAQISYIRLHADKPFNFLRRLTSPFTSWTQLTAFYVFRLHQLPVPAFIDYMDSENPNVRNFCLRMIIFYQQLENSSEILKLLGNEMELTRFLCIRAINDLRIYEGKELIKNRYPDETEKNRMEIIRALKNIGNAEDFDFLETIIKSGSVTAKTEACRSLCFMSSEGLGRLILLNQDAGLNLEQYLAHVTDPRN
jgi:hypothetical protein